MSKAEEQKTLSKLIATEIWCNRPSGSLYNTAEASDELLQSKEQSLRMEILPLLESLQHHAFTPLHALFCRKVSSTISLDGPSPHWDEFQYAQRSAWGISEIAEYLDQTYAAQIEELRSSKIAQKRRQVESDLARALNRLSG